jgi:hypothetical protein
MRRQKMQWYAGRGKFFSSQNGHYSVRLEDGTYIEVDPDLYEQRWRAYLERLGRKRTSWSEIMRAAERRWQQYCQVMDRFAENTVQWFADRGAGVFIDLPPGQEFPAALALAHETLALLHKEEKKQSAARRKMIWHAGRGRHCWSSWGYYSVSLEDGTRIEVISETYDQRFNGYLNDLGVKPTTWSQIMRKADAEWQRYCQVMDAFAENYQQWLDQKVSGVFVEQPQREPIAETASGNKLDCRVVQKGKGQDRPRMDQDG